MEEKAKSKVLIYIVVVLFLAVLMIAILGIMGYQKMTEQIAEIKGDTKNGGTVTKQETTQEPVKQEEATKPAEQTSNQVTKLESTGTFVISKIENNGNGYTLSVHMLADENRKVTEEEYQNVLNGGTIKFRGRMWKLSEESYDFLDSERKMLVNGKDQVMLTKNAIFQPAGKLVELKDYKSDEIVQLNIPKDAKVGDSFHQFEYNINTSKVKVLYAMGNEYIEQTEKDTAEFFNTFDVLDACSTYGECEAFMLNGKIVAIKTFRVSG